MRAVFVLLLAVALVAPAYGALCANPTVEAVEFSTGDTSRYDEATYGVEFTVSCDGKKIEGQPLFALVDGAVKPVAYNEGTYQVSFFAKSKSASSYVTVPVYDSEAAVKANKALREGGDARSAQSFSVNTSYSKGFNLALPVPIEFLVMAALATVFYNVQKRRN